MYKLQRKYLKLLRLLRIISKSEYKKRRFMLSYNAQCSEKDNVVFPVRAISGEKCFQKINQQAKFKRGAILVSFNRNAEIDAATLFYLKRLKEVCDYVVFVTDNPLLPGEENKLEGLAVYVRFERHNEYDFGSYKRGYEYLKKAGILAKTEELVFCNDSCIGPIKPLDNFFAEFQGLDFYGMSINDNAYVWQEDFVIEEKYSHVQSYFFVVKCSVFNNPVFDKFICGVKKEKNKIDVVINYEIGLTRVLETEGIIPVAKFRNTISNRDCTVFEWQRLMQEGYFLKKKILPEIDLGEVNLILNHNDVPFYIDNNRNLVFQNGEINAA